MAEENEENIELMDDGSEEFDPEHGVQPDIDSKYRMIILAAQRSKQIQRGANPRVDLDLRKHKSTRIALREIEDGRIRFDTLAE